jgi:hypothetical protein
MKEKRVNDSQKGLLFKNVFLRFDLHRSAFWTNESFFL